MSPISMNIGIFHLLCGIVIISSFPLLGNSDIRESEHKHIGLPDSIVSSDGIDEKDSFREKDGIFESLDLLNIPESSLIESISPLLSKTNDRTYRIQYDENYFKTIHDGKRTSRSTENGRIRTKRGYWTGTTQENTDYLEDSIENHFLFHITYKVFGTCSVFPAFSPKPIYMVTKCPINFYDTNIISYCQKQSRETNLDRCVIDMENIPVQDIRGIVYKNVYCSICHRAQNVTSWTADLVSNDISVLQVIDGMQSINIMENLGDIANCTQRIYPYHQNSIIECDKHEPRRHSSRALSADFGTPVKSADFLLSFQIFINFGINGKGHIIFSTEPVAQPDNENHYCRSNEVYYKGTCREVTCYEGYHFEDNNCRPNKQTFAEDPKAAEQAMNDLKYVTDLVNVTLRLNVTRDELILLDQDGADDVVKQNLAELLNVSISRIRNLTLECDTGTATGHVLEIRPVVVPEGESTPDNRTLLDSISAEESAEDSRGDKLKINENAYAEILSEKYDYGILNCNINPSNENKYLKSDMFTVAIHFELVGGRKKSSKSYVSAQLVVNNMKEMINSQSFNLVLNGTDLHVTEYVDNSNTTRLEKWCVHGQQEVKQGSEVSMMQFIDKQTGTMVRGIYVNSTNKYYGPDMFDLYVMVSGEIGSITNVSTVAFVYLCNEPRIENKECKRLRASVEDYTVFPENNSVLFLNEVFNMSQYEYKNDSSNDIMICIPTQSEVTSSLVYISSACGEKFEKVVVAEGYLSFILGITSILVTSAVLVTYGLFEKLRNLPGINTMNLTLALFLGELLFITSGVIHPESKWVCQMFGVSLHYLFLASFFWMNVMSFDIFRTFANKCIIARVRGVKKYFPRYALYAWGTPAVIVAVCGIIDFTHLFPNVRIGYGASSLHDEYNSLGKKKNGTPENVYAHSGQNLGCWIKEPVAALLAFGLPMLLIMFSNAVMFAKTIICIRKTAKLVKFKTRRSSRSSVNHMTGKDDVILYVRMSTMMGFTWIIGLASSVVSAFANTPTTAVCIVLHSLGILFVAFNCSQGLFIFFAFIFNKRVGNYYRDLFGGCKCQRGGKNLPNSTSTSTLVTNASICSSLDRL